MRININIFCTYVLESCVKYTLFALHHTRINMCLFQFVFDNLRQRWTKRTQKNVHNGLVKYKRSGKTSSVWEKCDRNENKITLKSYMESLAR